jgi:hypothetical protein
MIPLHDVRMVAIQFSFSNREVVPAVIRQRNRETPFEHVARHLRTAGERVIEPTENVYLKEFLTELEVAGFELVDAFYQCRPKGENLDRTYYMARFLFARRAFAVPSAEFALVRDSIRTELQGMLHTAFWRVRAFLNPFYQNGKEVAGQRSLSINLEHRVPLFLPDGHLVKSRRKENGKKVGDPQPLRPDFWLMVMGDNVLLGEVYDRGQPNSG